MIKAKVNHKIYIQRTGKRRRKEAEKVQRNLWRAAAAKATRSCWRPEKTMNNSTRKYTKHYHRVEHSSETVTDLFYWVVLQK